MESCTTVEQDVDKALNKFNGIQTHAENLFLESLKNLEDLNKELEQIDPETALNPEQAEKLKLSVEKVKEAISQLATEHRDLHVNVSRIGKSIDRHFVSDYPSVAPRAASFCSKTNKPIMEQAIAHHFYRQGLTEIGDSFINESQIESIDNQSPFANIERIAASLLNGETEPALKWVSKRQDELMHSALPFSLHVMHAIKLARENGLPEAIAYAREHFPPFAVRHESQLQAAVCALMWCRPNDSKDKYTGPDQYRHLLTPKLLGASTSELFIQEACTLLKLAPLSALASAVRAGCRVHSPLLEMRAKVTQQHVIDAWAGDEIPLQVEMTNSESNYHSVFACPILRQQATELNPPMRLLCGHVISRDALNKLTQGHKLKCPYCPMEQPPTEARQIYFS